MDRLGTTVLEYGAMPGTSIGSNGTNSRGLVPTTLMGILSTGGWGSQLELMVHWCGSPAVATLGR